MITGISPRILERLSAHLDGALPPRDRANLEARLSREPALAAALQALQETRALLRRAPQRRTPHHFTLTRSMAAEARPQRATGLNFVSAIATLMLVVVMAGDFLATGQITAFGAAPASEAPMALAAQAADMKDAPTTPEPEMGEVAPLTTPEFELYAAPEETERLIEVEPAPFELRDFMQQNARNLEIGLAVAAILAALLALRTRPSST